MRYACRHLVRQLPLLLIIAAAPLGVFGDQDAAGAQEQRQCEVQMLRIHKGIVRFHGDEKRLPDFLSDLWPNYCEKEDFICPAKDRAGDKIFVLQDPLQDPKFDFSTYSYEFIMKFWEGTSVFYRDYKNAQRDFFSLHFGAGDSVPIVRCFFHGKDNILNLTFGGKIVPSGFEWEEKFPVDHREYMVDALIPRARVRLVEPIPERRSGLSSMFVDLSSNYTAVVANSWVQYPPRFHEGFASLLENQNFLSKTRFDVRGVIQLKGHDLYRPFPLKVEGIRVRQKAPRLHFLLGAYGKSGMGDSIGEIRVNFADGAIVRFPIEYGNDVLDWHADPAASRRNEVREKVAWMAQRRTEEGKVESLRLYEFTGANPNPEKEIASIDFEVKVTDSVVSKSAPALFAITLEPSR